jgi:hypothetical protein
LSRRIRILPRGQWLGQKDARTRLADQQQSNHKEQADEYVIKS